MSIANHLSQDDLLLFALQFLPEEQMLAAQEHLLECEDCRRQVSFVQGDLASYALTAESHAVPAGARERLLRSIAKEKRVAPETVSSVAPAKSAGPLLVATPTAESSGNLSTRRIFSIEDVPVRKQMGFGGWAGWAVAAVAIGAAGLQYQQDKSTKDQLAEVQSKYSQTTENASKASVVLDTLTDASAKQVALHLPLGTKPTVFPEGHASYLAKKGSVVFVANNLDQLQANTTYELWLIPAGPNAKPIPAGTFKPDTYGRASLVTSGLPVGVDAGAFGVTIEPEGGSKTPTLPIVLAGE
jgi:anti-sigma-K factor RskA